MKTNYYYHYYYKIILVVAFVLLANNTSVYGQLVASSKFGKNRVQFEKFNWRIIEKEKFSFLFYDSSNVNYISEIVNICEKELGSLELEFDFQIPKHFNIVFYYSFEQYMQSNAGLQLNWYNTNQITRVINNKIILYYSSKTEDLRKQIRQGLIRLILEYIFFNQEKGEENQEEFLGSLPKWFIYGLISYKAENWNTDLDYKLKVIVQERSYKKYKIFIKDNPLFAGQAFWYYIELKYGISVIDKMIDYLKYDGKIKNVLSKTLYQSYRRVIEDIFPFFETHFKKDNQKRKDNPKGTLFTSTNFTTQTIVTIQANPQLKKGIYGIVEFKNGVYKVFVSKSRNRRKQILKTGIYLYESSLSQNYPLISWQQSGLKLGVIYFDKTYLHFSEYDIIENTMKNDINLSKYFVSIQDFKYFQKDQKLLLSAVRNGQSDIFLFDLKNETIENITNDIYDDIDPSYVTLLQKTGIIFSSNRPENYKADSINKKMNATISKENFKIFLADYSNSKAYHFISCLTPISLGNDRYPSQFTNTTFSYLSDKNGIVNRYIGKFFTKTDGIDTLYYLNNDIYFNLNTLEKDATLKKANKAKFDKITYVPKTKDSTQNYAYTNYSRSIIESKNVTGFNYTLTDLKYNRSAKVLFKSNVVADDNLILKETFLAPTFFIKSKQKRPNFLSFGNNQKGLFSNKAYVDSFDYYKNYFLSEFQFNPLAYLDTQKKPPSTPNTNIEQAKIIINRAETSSLINLKYRYKFYLFDLDVDLFNNDLLANKYQTYTGSGPIVLNQQGLFNSMLKLRAIDILEDLHITLGYRFPTNISNGTSDFLADIKYLKYKLDYGFSYYRSSVITASSNKIISNYYTLNFSYPIDILRRIEVNIGARRDYFNYKYSLQNITNNKGSENDSINWNGTLKIEYVYDNSINPALNIYKGFRYKVYGEFFTNLTKNNISTTPNKDIFSLNRNTFNIGADFRYYKEIYKNLIWANKISADFSFGNDRVLYYLGGADGWLIPTFYNNNPDLSLRYSYQTLALNLRGYKQNISNGTQNIVYNSEVRFPIFATLLRRPIGSAFIRNFQLLLFLDAGVAANNLIKIKPNKVTFSNSEEGNVSVEVQTSKYPFTLGYGYGFRTSISSYFLRFDIGYPIGSPLSTTSIYYLSLGLDF